MPRVNSTATTSQSLVGQGYTRGNLGPRAGGVAAGEARGGPSAPLTAPTQRRGGSVSQVLCEDTPGRRVPARWDHQVRLLQSSPASPKH